MLRPVGSSTEPEVEIRSLDDYDTALGLSDRFDGGVA